MHSGHDPETSVASESETQKSSTRSWPTAATLQFLEFRLGNPA
jgi:hypothetical protein